MNYNKTILIVGFGSIGRRHTNNILKHTDSSLIIFTRRKNIKNSEFYLYAKNKKRIKILSNFDKCLEQNPSVAFVTNETSLHTVLALELAKKGIDLFIEKPLSNSLRNLSALTRIVQKNKIVAMVGCNFRFYPPICKIKELVEKQFTGRIISVQLENSSYLPDWHPCEDYSKNYAARKDLGGGVTLTQIHELDYLTWIFGTVKPICSISGKFSDLQVTADDGCFCIMRAKNNVIVELHLDYFSKPYYKRIKIRGTSGTIYWDSIENNVRFLNNKKSSWEILKIRDNYKLKGKPLNRMYVDELKYFLNCVTNREQPMNDLYESSNILKCALSLK